MYIYVHIKKEYIEIYVHWIRENGPPLTHDLDTHIEQFWVVLIGFVFIGFFPIEH